MFPIIDSDRNNKAIFLRKNTTYISKMSNIPKEHSDQFAWFLSQSRNGGNIYDSLFVRTFEESFRNTILKSRSWNWNIGASDDSADQYSNGYWIEEVF